MPSSFQKHPLWAHPYKARAFPLQFIFPHSKNKLYKHGFVSRNFCVHTKPLNSDSKRCSIHARPVCGTRILPPRCTKMEKTWSMCINLMWCIQAQHNKTTFALVKLIGSVASAPRTQACSPPLLLLLHDVAVSDYGGDVGWWHHRFTKYMDWLYTRKCKGVIFRFIHSETRFQKIAVSGSQNTRSIWYDTTFLHIQQNASLCIWALRNFGKACTNIHPHTFKPMPLHMWTFELVSGFPPNLVVK